MKEQPLQERMDPQLVKEHSQLQATSTTRVGSHKRTRQRGDAHTTMCTKSRTRPCSSQQKRPKESTVSSTTYVLLRELNRCSSRTRLRIRGCEFDRRRWAQTELGSPAVTAHRQNQGNPCPDAETERQVPTLQKIPKTVEIPQEQFMETNP